MDGSRKSNRPVLTIIQLHRFVLCECREFSLGTLNIIIGRRYPVDQSTLPTLDYSLQFFLSQPLGCLNLVEQVRRFINLELQTNNQPKVAFSLPSHS